MFPVEPISAKMLDYYVGRRDAFLIDLRSREEYRTGHMKGAVNLPYEEFEEMSEYDFPRGKILECMEAIHTAAVQAPVHLGDIILADIAGTGVDLVATKTVGEMK